MLGEHPTVYYLVGLIDGQQKSLGFPGFLD
jgi:hypothetical protein